MDIADEPQPFVKIVIMRNAYKYPAFIKDVIIKLNLLSKFNEIWYHIASISNVLDNGKNLEKLFKHGIWKQIIDPSAMSKLRLY